MHSGKLIFAQLMEHLLEKTLARCVARYRGNHKIQTFNCQDCEDAAVDIEALCVPVFEPMADKRVTKIVNTR